MQVQVTFFCIHISPVRSSAIAARPIVQRIFPGAADRGPLTISAMFNVYLQPVSFLMGSLDFHLDYVQLIFRWWW